MKLCNEKVFIYENWNKGNKYNWNNQANKFGTIIGNEFISE